MSDRANDYFESKAVGILKSPVVEEVLRENSTFSSSDSYLQSPDGKLFVTIMSTHLKNEHQGRLHAARKL